MSNIQVKVSEVRPDYTVLEINLLDNLTPEDLQNLKVPGVEIESLSGICVSGRAPIWVYACVVTQVVLDLMPIFVATYDPKLQGYVVTYSDSETFPVGHLITD